MASLLLRHLPLPVVQDLVAEWIALQRYQAVGDGRAEFSPDCEENQWPEPPEGGPWHLSSLFTTPPQGAPNWTESVQEAAAWRAAHGVPAP